MFISHLLDSVCPSFNTLFVGLHLSQNSTFQHYLNTNSWRVQCTQGESC